MGISVLGDWPQFMGPTRDGVVAGKLPAGGWLKTPEPLWKLEVGRGFSGPVVVGDRAILHHRQGNEEVLEAVDRETGRRIWKAVQPTAYEDDFGFDDGPRATPIVQDGVVYTFGAEGRLTAVRLLDGSTVWSRPLGRELKAAKGFFGIAPSPLWVSGRLVVQLGGSDGAGVMALDPATGRELWRATRGEAGYASPVVAEVGGQERVVVFNREGVRVLDPGDGRVLGEVAWRARMSASVNGATPLIGPDGVLVTTSYGVGANWLEWGPGGSLRSKWSNDESLSAHFVTPVRLGAQVCGFHGRQEQGAEIRCVDLGSGKVRWESPRLGTGSLMIWGDQLLVLLETGEWVVAKAETAGWKELFRHQVLGQGTRAVPAMDRGILFARDKSRWVAVRLVPKSPGE
jgi:hypothetical protein